MTTIGKPAYLDALTPAKGPPFATLEPPKEVEEVKDACAAGRLEQVQQILSRYVRRQQTAELDDLSVFAPALKIAVQNKDAALVSYLLSAGLPLDSIPLYDAIQAKSAAIFQAFINHGWNINQPLTSMTPPALAFILDDKDLTEWFLAHGADPNAMCDIDQTPLSNAVCLASIDIIRQLFAYGGDIRRGQLLHYAVLRKSQDRIEVLRILLDQGAPINQIKYENHTASYNMRWIFGLGTPLHKAASLGKADVVEFLIENGADPTIKDSKGKTALEAARAKGHLATIKLLEDWLHL